MLGALFSMKHAAWINLRQSDWHKTNILGSLKRLGFSLIWLFASIYFHSWIQEKLGNIFMVNQIGLFLLSFGMFGLS